MKFALAFLAATALSAVAQSLTFGAPLVNATITAGKNFTVTLDYKPSQGIVVEKGILIYASGRESGPTSPDYWSRRGHLPAFGLPSTDNGILLFSSQSYKPEEKNGTCCSNDLSLEIPKDHYADGPAVITLLRVFFVGAAATPEVSIKHLPVHLIGNGSK